MVWGLLLLAACNNSTSYPATVNAVRGRYLITAVLACGDCHTTPQANNLPSFDPADFLAGGREFDVAMGGVTQKFFAPNLTSDLKTGIGSWTDAQIKRAITQGIDNQGNALFPVMPYISFANLNDNDLQSIVLALRALPAKSHETGMDTFSITSPAKTVDPAKVPQTTLAASDPNYASAQNGRYLAGLAGACIHCHTPTGPSFDEPLDLSRAFAGGQKFPLFPGFTSISANLTPDATGLAGWTTDDIIATVRFDLEKGHGRPLCPPMPGGPNRDGDMTQTDLVDIANYLTTLAPVQNGRFGCTDGGVPYGLDGGT